MRTKNLETDNAQQERNIAWLTRPPTLRTAPPQKGFELATKLDRIGFTVTQPSPELRDKLRAANEQDTA